jgi:sugar phosphate isomerase/epimerase
MHPRLSVSAICSNRWTLEQDLEFWAAEGIDSVGLALRKMEQHGLRDAIDLVAGSGVRVTNILGVNTMRLDDPSTWPPALDRLYAAVGAAVRLNAGCLVVTTGRAGSLRWDEAAQVFCEAIGSVASIAYDAGIPLALEHTHALRSDIGFLHTLRDAVDVAEELMLGVCVEVQACWTERGLAQTLRDSLEQLALVQLSDFAVGTLATPDRLVPGDGDIPLDRFVADVLAAGYRGVFDLELIGPRIDAEGYPSAIRRAVAATERLLADAGV